MNKSFDEKMRYAPALIIAFEWTLERFGLLKPEALPRTTEIKYK